MLSSYPQHPVLAYWVLVMGMYQLPDSIVSIFLIRWNIIVISLLFCSYLFMSVLSLLPYTYIVSATYWFTFNFNLNNSFATWCYFSMSAFYSPYIFSTATYVMDDLFMPLKHWKITHIYKYNTNVYTVWEIGSLIKFCQNAALLWKIYIDCDKR